MTSLGKAAIWMAAVALTAGSLSGQTLAEAARKEKARRAAAKTKTAVVVTNADLGKARKKPALISTREADAAAAEAAAEAGAGEENAKPEPAKLAATPAPSAVPAPQSEAATAEEESVSYEKRKDELGQAYERARERAELLALKMRALTQQLYTFDNMTTKDQIQKSIAETYKKLLEARADADKAKQDLEKFLNQAATAKSGPIWVK